jgi:phosphatidylglycerol:prolipoprotein diacylglycerol transferase
MYPSLYHFFYDVFGLDITGLKAIKSFGFFVAIGFITGNALFIAELKRMEKVGIFHPQMRKVLVGKPISMIDLFSNALLGFLLGYKIVPAFLFSSQGNIIAGVIGAGIMGYWRYSEVKKTVLPTPKEEEQAYHAYQHAGPITGIAAVFGFIGARLFAYLEDPGPISELFTDPFRGFTVYGGMICGVLAGSIYLYKNKLSLLRFYDAVSPALILSYGVGRIGCQVAGDGDWGIVNNKPNPTFLPDWLWSYRYPNNVNMEGIPMDKCTYNDEYCTILPEPVFPTPLYETIMCIMIFGVLWYYRKKIIVPGILFFMYVAFSGLERLLIEQIRVNVPYHFAGLEFTQAELISVIMIITGIAGIFILLKRHKKLPPNASNGHS